MAPKMSELLIVVLLFSAMTLAASGFMGDLTSTYAREVPQTGQIELISRSEQIHGNISIIEQEGEKVEFLEGNVLAETFGNILNAIKFSLFGVNILTSQISDVATVQGLVLPAWAVPIATSVVIVLFVFAMFSAWQRFST